MTYTLYRSDDQGFAQTKLGTHETMAAAVERARFEAAKCRPGFRFAVIHGTAVTPIGSSTYPDQIGYPNN